MLDLKENVGLNIKFDQERYALIFGEGLTDVEPATRTLDQMKEVLVDPSLATPEQLYFMYRDVHRIEDEDKIREHTMRFDITVIKPDKLGKELMKTAGHYHQGSYPELYEVVSGRAICLLQRPDEKDHKKIKEVIVVHAKQGQKIVCLPDFGHILINPGPEPLITANWVSSRFQSQYDKYKEGSGAAYYAFPSGNEIRWEKNNFYNEIPEIEIRFPSDEMVQFGLSSKTPMYSLVGQLEKIDFLNNPANYKYDSVFK